jgi:hypothetical protein
MDVKTKEEGVTCAGTVGLLNFISSFLVQQTQLLVSTTNKNHHGRQQSRHSDRSIAR